MAEIIVSGQKVLIDEDVKSWAEAFSWWINPGGYVLTKIPTRTSKPYTAPIHRLVVGAPDGLQVDHINRDKLDNRRRNLRLCTPSENSRNIPTRKNKTSRYRGVSWNNRTRSWQVVLRINGRLKWCGSYSNEDDAAKVASPHFAGIKP